MEPIKNITILRAGPGDAARLTEITWKAKSHWGYPQGWLEIWKGSLRIDPRFIAIYSVFAARVEGEIIGFYALCPEGEKIRLEHLWVMPETMGRGVGRQLIQHAAGEARTLGFGKIEIESDPNAEGFYLRMGAVRTGVNVTMVDGRRRELPLLEFWV